MNQEQIDLTGSQILIVDDQLPTVDILRRTLEVKGYRISLAPSGEIALELAARTAPDLILLDLLMPGIDGFETCRRLKGHESSQEIPVIFITAHDETDRVIEGFRVGGVDYISKPFQTEEVLIRVETHLKNAQLTKALLQKNIELQQEIQRRKQAEDALQMADEQLTLISQQEAKRWGIEGFVSQSPTMSEILANIRRLHHNDTTRVLIQGETGTGKEMIARAIHYGGPRSKGPFFTLNCSAIPSGLAEATLFGHIRGAFTGAETDRKGYFELANNGTLFFDEIGEMPFELQAKLLRALENGVFMPVSGTHEKHTDVRILSATNVDLTAKIVAGKFREDLYYRLAGFVVTVPPLRERKEDIPLLVSHFLSRLATEMRVEKPALSEGALAALTSYPFPGNIRELRNIIERALIESGCRTIQPEHLHLTPRLTTSSSSADESSLIQEILAGDTGYSQWIASNDRQ
ncbi:sigma-54-dependent Fis family transcriptional regulator [Candidatus Poribacteria bacterium]|nr:sigma-54-dependent Fis family transcriptional regulator [Candidatus Poribacteria bacterium]